MGSFGSKLAHPHNSASSRMGFKDIFFLKVCIMKEAKRHRKFILVVFAKKVLMRVNLRVVVWPKILCP